MAGRGVSAPFLLRLDRMFASARFQALAARLPIGRGFARRDGAAIFDVLQGFVASQVLAALVDLGLLRRLLDEPARAERLAISLALPLERLEELLRAAVALKLLKRRRDGRYSLARRGAAIVGVPGLEAMIAHNAAFYADMADPVALMKGGGETHLARFWPYVQGEVGQAEAGRYSDLMAQSQRLVAQDTLAQVSLKGRRRLMDVGGGTGAFMAEALTVWPELEGALLDLPEVLSAARSRLSGSGLEHRVSLKPQSFREATLPTGADVISLVRVLYDHDDETVAALLSRCFAALPPGGMLLVSEPMSGGAHPDRTTDVYFAFYTMAMGTGRVRSAARIAEMCEDAGFSSVHAPRPRRPYITSVLTCVKPG